MHIYQLKTAKEFYNSINGNFTTTCLNIIAASQFIYIHNNQLLVIDIHPITGYPLKKQQGDRREYMKEYFRGKCRKVKKAATVSALMLVMFSSYGQKRDNFWLKQGVSAAAMAAAGFLHGTNEVSVHDYRRYAARHPNANPKWANPKLSFRNKYVAWPDDKDPAYWGSKTVLAWTTDAYHMRSTARNLLMVGNIGVTMSLYQKPNWKQIVVQAAASWAFFAIGSGAAHAYYKPIN